MSDQGTVNEKPAQLKGFYKTNYSTSQSGKPLIGWYLEALRDSKLFIPRQKQSGLLVTVLPQTPFSIWFNHMTTKQQFSYTLILV